MEHDRNDRKTVVHVEIREGTCFYSDELGHADARAIATLSLAVVITGDGKGANTVWVTRGTEGSIAEALATFYLKNPGMKDAVDGLYLRGAKRAMGHL